MPALKTTEKLSQLEQRDLNLICSAFYDLFSKNVSGPRKATTPKMVMWLKNYHKIEPLMDIDPIMKAKKRHIKRVQEIRKLKKENE